IVGFSHQTFSSKVTACSNSYVLRFSHGDSYERRIRRSLTSDQAAFGWSVRGADPAPAGALQGRVPQVVESLLGVRPRRAVRPDARQSSSGANHCGHEEETVDNSANDAKGEFRHSRILLKCFLSTAETATENGSGL